MPQLEHISLLNDTGIREQIEAERVENGLFRLDFSPAAVMGLARDDIIRVHEDGSWELVVSGGNVCVQFFIPSPEGGEADACENVFRAVGGHVDNRRRRAFALTLPSSVGRKRLISTLEQYLPLYPNVRWQFGNAIGTDGKPLPGWESFANS